VVVVVVAVGVVGVVGVVVIVGVVGVVSPSPPPLQAARDRATTTAKINDNLDSSMTCLLGVESIRLEILYLRAKCSITPCLKYRL
jgi:hypothetical protein